MDLIQSCWYPNKAQRQGFPSGREKGEGAPPTHKSKQSVIYILLKISHLLIRTEYISVISTDFISKVTCPQRCFIYPLCTENAAQIIITKNNKYLNSILHHFQLSEIQNFSEGTLCTYPGQKRFRISSHLREKEVLPGTSSVEKFVFGRNSLKMSVSFDKNLNEKITLQYCLVLTL